MTDREIKIAHILRPLGNGPLGREQAAHKAQLLGLHPSTVYRLRTRFLRDPVASSLLPDDSGRLREPRRLPAPLEAVLTDVVERWLPSQRELAHPVLDTHTEARRRCHRSGLESPSRNTVARRMAAQSPLEFIQRLAALVPRPRLHLIRFHGVLAPNAKLRALVVPQEPEAPVQEAARAECEANCAHHRPVRLS